MKPHSLSPALLRAFSLVLALSSLASSDIIVLRNGNEIQGEILRADDQQVIVRFSGGTLRLRPKDVKEIRRQDREEYLLEEGEKQLRRGDYSEAVKSYAEAAREDTDSVRARTGLFTARLRLAVSLREVGRHREARESLEKLLDEHPDREEVRNELRRLEETLRKARADEETAVARLQQGDVEGALWRLQKLYDRFPDRREELGKHLADAIVRKGDLHLGNEEWAKAAEQYLAAISVRPNVLPVVQEHFVAAKLNELRSLTENGDFVALEAAAREALEVAPASEPLRYYYGLGHEGQGNARAAAEEYLLITEGRRPRDLEQAVGDLRRQVEEKLVAANQVRPTAHPEASRVLSGAFHTDVSRRFKIRHKNRKIAREVVSVAERIYADLYRRLGCSTHLRSRILVTMHPTREDYLLTSTEVASWSGGSHRVGRRMGVLSEHEISCYQDQPGLLTETIPHEVAHSLLAHRVNYREIPLWANEGFAILVEPSYVHRYYRRLIRQELVRRNLASVGEMTKRTDYPDENVGLFYAQSFSLVEYLVAEKDLETFVDFIQSLATGGVRLDLALRRHYGLQGITALQSRWRAWFEHRVMRRG